MPRSSARGQVEPLPALVAVFAVCVGLSLYVAVLATTEAASDRERSLAGPAADRVEATTTAHDAVEPTRLPDATEAAPLGHGLNVTLRAADQRWSVGPPRPKPARTDATTRTVTVRVAPGRVVPGELEVHVWPER